jgi:hypothetical protein
MYYLINISRDYSSHYETSKKKCFSSLEDVSNYLCNDWYEEFCETFDFPEEWDEENMGCAFPSRIDFKIDFIRNKVQNKQRIVLFRSYNKSKCYTPYEIVLEKF